MPARIAMLLTQNNQISMKRETSLVCVGALAGDSLKGE